jgi:arsenite methyltransferase
LRVRCGTGDRLGGAGCGLDGGSYSEVEKRELPRAAVEASLGCGNPVALATVSPGEVVLDLGSGGGIDVLLSARRFRRAVKGRWNDQAGGGGVEGR